MAELLAPFAGEDTVTPRLLDQLQSYLDLLLRWNARVNLTAVRDPEMIVTRHFGESLFAARVLLYDQEVEDGPAWRSEALLPQLEGRKANVGGARYQVSAGFRLADVGSGAGFPGIPIKLFAPTIELTLIESDNKKAVFLREVVRSLQIEGGTEVFAGRAERWERTADLLTFRAVEHFERVLPVAAKLVAEGGQLGLMVGAAQVHTAHEALGETWAWEEVVRVPGSHARVVLIARRINLGVK